MRHAGGRTKPKRSLRGSRKHPRKPGKSGQPRRKRLEAFVPLQRHLYGEEKVFLPCPQSRKEIPGRPR